MVNGNSSVILIALLDTFQVIAASHSKDNFKFQLFTIQDLADTVSSSDITP